MKLTRTVVFLLVLMFLPGATALTWTPGVFSDEIDTSVTSTVGEFGSSASNGAVGLFLVHDDDLGFVYSYRCVQGNTPLCVRQTNPNAPDGMDVTPIPGTGFAYCGTTSTTLTFYLSEDQGQSWASSTPHTTTGTFGCGVAVVGQNVWVAGVNSSGANIRLSKSLDGGSTWSTFYLPSGSSASGGTGSFVRIAARDANNVSLTFEKFSAETLGRCYTTTGGDTTEEWTCPTTALLTGIAGLLGNDLVYSSATGKWHGVTGASTGTALTHYSFTTPGGLPTISTVVGGASGIQNGFTINAYDSSTIIVSYIEDTGGTTFGKTSFSTDGGINFASETAHSGLDPQAQNMVAGTFGSDGTYFAGFSYVEDVDNDLVLLISQGGLSTLIEETATATVTDLTGFAVDSTGTRAIARTDLGKNVKLWSATTLGTADASVNTNCDLGSYSHNDMVFSKHDGDLVAFINCADADNPVGSGGPGDPQFLSIRTPLGSEPTADDFDGCTPQQDDSGTSNTCPWDIDLSQFDNPVDNPGLAQINQIQEFPISYSNGAGGNSIGSFHRVAWGFSTTDGQVGVAVYNKQFAINGAQHVTRSRGYATTLAEDFCVGEDNGQYYLAAADSATQSKVWPLSWTNFDTSGNLDVSVDAPTTLATGHNAQGIACGGGQVAVNTATTAVLMPRDGGTPLKTVTGITGTQHGVFISEEFVPSTTERCYSVNGSSPTSCRQFWGHVDGSSVKIYDAFDGTQTCTLTIPAGTAEYVVSNNKAGWVWVATNSNVYGYNVQEGACTTEDPVGQQPLPGPVTTTDPLAPNRTVNVFGANAPVPEGVTNFGFKLFMAALLLFGFAGIGFAAFKQSHGGTMIGGFSGFLTAWGFDFLETKVVFTLVVLVVALIVVIWKTGR